MPTEYDAFLSAIKNHQVKDFSRPFIDTCLCGLISLRKATMIFSTLDVLVLGFLCERILCIYRPWGSSLIGLLFPFGPLAGFLVCAVLGFVGAAIRDEKFVRLYTMAVLLWPAIYLCFAFALGAPFEKHVILALISFCIGLWKHVVARNLALALCVGHTGDDSFTRHDLLLASRGHSHESHNHDSNLFVPSKNISDDSGTVISS